MPNLTKRFVESLAPESKDVIHWDDAIKGFGVKVTPKGRRVYLYKYRSATRTQRKAALGVHGNITCEHARKLAQEWAHEVARGHDPAANKQRLKESPTIAQLCERYLNEHAMPRKKPQGAQLDQFYTAKYIIPRLGRLNVAGVTRNDMVKFHYEMRDTPSQANRVLAMLSKMFNLAEKWGLRPELSNPVKHVDKFPEKPRERFLTTEEVQRLLEVLDEAEETAAESIYLIALIRLLMFTGARLREIMHAQWDWVNWEKGWLQLPDSKTGQRTIQLSGAAMDVLQRLPRPEGNPYIIVGNVAGQHLINARKPWLRIREQAGLTDVRLHDLRHSYAALCIEAGIPLYHVGKLLGHTQARTTERYAHLADDPVKAAAERVGSSFMKLKKDAQHV